MKFKIFENSMTETIVALWNDEIASLGFFKPWTVSSFTNKFLKNPHFKKEGLICLFDEQSFMIGFGEANVVNGEKDPSTTPGYITCIAVREKYRRKGYGSLILQKLEEFLKNEGKKFVRNFFLNPTNLEWYVPGYDKHNHPGAPAISYNSSFYLFLLANGYNTNGQQDAYHLNLSDYELPEYVINKKIENEKEGYTLTYYNEKIHFGFEGLFNALNNEGWKNAVSNHIKKGDGPQLLIAQKDGEILGFTGPIFTEDSGRGYLAGIGIHPKVQGRGLGKTLFCELCYQHKIKGSKFMTLFTGSDNPARNIYMYAGMKPVQSFAIMRKDFKK